MRKLINQVRSILLLAQVDINYYFAVMLTFLSINYIVWALALISLSYFEFTKPGVNLTMIIFTSVMYSYATFNLFSLFSVLYLERDIIFDFISNRENGYSHINEFFDMIKDQSKNSADAGNLLSWYSSSITIIPAVKGFKHNIIFSFNFDAIHSMNIIGSRFTLSKIRDMYYISQKADDGPDNYYLFKGYVVGVRSKGLENIIPLYQPNTDMVLRETNYVKFLKNMV